MSKRADLLNREVILCPLYTKSSIKGICVLPIVQTENTLVGVEQAIYFLVSVLGHRKETIRILLCQGQAWVSYVLVINVNTKEIAKP